ncbi:uncharacterized protein LOC118241139 [Electrophorus electricus]|uniref:uncharacterized protein LOC118241139 n=1 Tax=Electrophorus electricus TaxID=8005 RepID=UPI0015CF8E7E|nr:uncharacterized protein LOC118241139 [Electrophorus electricus]
MSVRRRSGMAHAARHTRTHTKPNWLLYTPYAHTSIKTGLSQERGDTLLFHHGLGVILGTVSAKFGWRIKIMSTVKNSTRTVTNGNTLEDRARSSAPLGTGEQHAHGEEEEEGKEEMGSIPEEARNRKRHKASALLRAEYSPSISPYDNTNFVSSVQRLHRQLGFGPSERKRAVGQQTTKPLINKGMQRHVLKAEAYLDVLSQDMSTREDVFCPLQGWIS